MDTKIRSPLAVDGNLWRAYLSRRKNPKTKHDKRIIVYTFRKKDFFQTLENNIWATRDVSLGLCSEIFYLYVMLLIIYYFVDRGSTDDACAEEHALKGGSMHLSVYGIELIVHGYFSLLIIKLL